MKEYGLKQSWTKFGINIPFYHNIELLSLLKNDEVLILKNSEKLVLYNIRERTHRDLRFQDIRHGLILLLNLQIFVESLISPSLKSSSSATIFDTIPSTVAIDPVVSTSATNPSASPLITTTPTAAGGARDRERGKRPHPDGGVNLEEEPLIRRTRVSGPSALLHCPVRALAPSGPVAAGASASASASPSLPVLPPWAPRLCSNPPKPSTYCSTAPPTASSRITTAPPTVQPLTALHSSTVVCPIVTADVGPQQNDSVIHLDSPPREGEMADGTEEADQHNQEAVGTEAAS
ncbi:endochitinase A1-like [Cornus florida]|uniref:endochitinase A1-like n=1 Tax=Cornus florida TaxID=4283 RepID=UPI00289D8587|nr:endochitinase A1-like [Cornus florida]